jgi:hypothetical protein
MENNRLKNIAKKVTNRASSSPPPKKTSVFKDVTFAIFYGLFYFRIFLRTT